MRIISEADKKVMSILGKAAPSQGDCRLIKYCVQTEIEDGVLLFNTLTRELLLLTHEEYAQRFQLQQLKDRWFAVPEQLDEMQKVDQVRWVLRATTKPSEHINFYNIFTTTDCNARCFYCFEKGRSRIPMSDETAHKTARYIIDHCGGQRIGITWFGGEPLFNTRAMDIISQDLREAGMRFHSSTATNGYLFDNEAVQKAKELWNMRSVQITLDGTEEVYNRSKAYIYRDGISPYQVVLGNIARLLEARIPVRIRLNMDLYNAENLEQLVEELAQRFAGAKGLTVYAHHLFDGTKPIAHAHSDAEWELRFEAMARLNRKIKDHGLAKAGRLQKTLPLTSCMVDHGGALVIAPTGEIGLCEHYSDSGFIGHIDREEFDLEAVKVWREVMPPVPGCKDCYRYPECIKLKNCTLDSVCYRHDVAAKRETLKKTMKHEYRLWKDKITEEEAEDLKTC